MIKKVIQYYTSIPVSVKKMLIAALAIAIFFILKAYTNHLINQYNYPFSWALISLKLIITYIVWILLAPLIYRISTYFQRRQRALFLNIVKFIVYAIAIAFLHQLIVSRLDDFINYLNSGYMKSFWGQSSKVVLVIGTFSSFIELLVIVAIFLALDYQKRYFQNQKQLIAAQLNALRMQLHPHFLFNTLHSIASMIDINTKNAQKMLSKLGNLLRSMLEYDAEQLVTVKEELAFIKDYLDLEQIRYQDRVSIKYEISDEVLYLKIPNMIFQPLVENAIKYGAIPTITEGEICIDFTIETNTMLNKEMLTMTISNTFNTQSMQQKPEGTGFGHLNIRKRLQQFYGNLFVFSAAFKTPELYVSSISVPINSQL